ncbi:hypothetical protein TetV_104 [Tetraselmis virus 1]|uniref:Uncharacterized protein n=1 Tax=Tetraselmis virus 1 TaxID=2060617 RepID=A0A2P0VMS8_9VIRU|nr:hypothetical protein QJ968_gp104 [Tetraselmis virus 1]AUF82196.1 hypothetical protein TetV_104 [Tetraselmis virus 1]
MSRIIFFVALVSFAGNSFASSRTLLQRATATLEFDPPPKQQKPPGFAKPVENTNSLDFCKLNHKTPRALFEIKENPLTEKKGRKGSFEIVVSNDLEIMPVANTLLRSGLRRGHSKIKGPGINSFTEVVSGDYLKMDCGRWVYDSSGVYSYDFEIDDSRVFIQYFIRSRMETIDEYINSLPVKVVYQLSQENISNDNVRLNAGVLRENGAITIILRNVIMGDNL